MDDKTDDIDRTDAEILTATLSDEALEAAAGAGRANMTGHGVPMPLCSVDPSVC